MPKPPLAPAHVIDAKTNLRRIFKAAQAARLRWTSMRDTYKAGVAMGIGECTMRMWDAEAALETATERWRDVLAERAAMPIADRWDLAALERWTAAQDKAGAE